MNDQSQIKLIRLNTGEDIVANCVDDDANTTLHLGNPMKVFIKRVSEANKAMLVMMPWLPLEIIEEDSASISYQDIITIIEPRQSFIEYYSSTVEQYKEVLSMQGDDMFGESEEDGDEEEDMDENTMQEILDMIKEKKKNSLH